MPAAGAARGQRVTVAGARAVRLVHLGGARRLPTEWVALLESAPRAPEVDEPHGTRPGHGHTLATGRPGSRHPLSESGPRPAQTDSVATENPHGDSKLSSATAPGVEPLATAGPGPEETLATAKDERHEK